jgi:hypothetical protein
VYRYSGRSLSNPEDRLDALAGVANELKQTWQDDYFSGMWRRCFIELLTWYTFSSDDNYGPHLGRSARAPSWSWASLSSRVIFTVIANVQASMVPLANDDPMKITLRCKSIAAVNFRNLLAQRLWDVISDEALLDKVQYLFLGTAKRNKNVFVGIIVIPTGQQEGLLKRLGYFDHLDLRNNQAARKLLEETESRVITLR